MDLQCTQIIEQDHLNEPSLTQTEAKTQIQVGTLEIGDVKYPILSGITKIGRHPAHQIFLEDIMVSKFHAEIEANGKSVFISDLKSSNKTRLDDAVLTPWRFYMVQDGASLKFGNVEARFFLKRPEDERIPVPATPEPGLSPGLDESQEDSVIEATARSQDDARFRRPAVPNRRKIPMMNPLTPGDDPLETQVNSGDDIQNLETQQSTQQHDRTSDSDLHDMDASRSANSSQSAKDDRRNIQEVNTQCLAVGDDAEGDGLPGPSKSPSRGNHKKSSDHPEPSRSLPQHPSNIQTLETQASTSEGPSKDHSNHSSMIHDFQTQKVNLDDHIQSLKTQKTEEPGKSRGKSLSPHERDVQSLNADIWGADDDNLQDIHDLQTQSNLEFLENSRRRKEDVFRSQSSSPDLVADSEQMIIDFAHHGSIFDDSKSHENRRRKMAMGGGNQRVVDVPENFPAINDKSSKSDGKSAGDDDDVETDFEDDLLTLGNHSDVSKNNSQKSQSSGNDFTSLVSEVERILEDSGDETDFNDLDKSVKVIKSSKSDLKNSKSSKNNSTSLKSVLNHSDEETDFEEEVTVSKMSDSLKVIPASSDDDTDFEADPLPSKSFRKKSPDKRKLSSESPKSPKSVGQANRTISVSSDSSKCGNDRRESSKSSKSSQKSSKSPPENDPKSSKVINGHSSSEIIRETSPKSSGVIRISSDSDTDYEDPSKIPNKSKSSRNDVDDSNLPPEVLKMLKKAETSRDIYADDDDDYDPYSAPTQVIVQSKSLRRPQKNITSNLESCSGPSKTPGNHHDFDHTTEDSMPTQKIDRKFTTKNAAFDFDDLEPTQKMNHPGISGRKTPRMLDFDDDLEPTQISSRSAPGPSNARPDDFDDLGPTQILNFDKTQSQPLPDDPSSRKWPFEDEENSKKRMALLNDSDPTQIIDVQAIKRQNNRQKNHKSFGDSGVNMNVKLRSQQISSSDSPELKGHAETISSSSRVTKRQRTTRNPQTLENPLKKTNSTPKKMKMAAEKSIPSLSDSENSDGPDKKSCPARTPPESPKNRQSTRKTRNAYKTPRKSEPIPPEVPEGPERSPDSSTGRTPRKIPQNLGIPKENSPMHSSTPFASTPGRKRKFNLSLRSRNDGDTKDSAFDESRSISYDKSLQSHKKTGESLDNPISRDLDSMFGGGEERVVDPGGFLMTQEVEDILNSSDSPPGTPKDLQEKSRKIPQTRGNVGKTLKSKDLEKKKILAPPGDEIDSQENHFTNLKRRKRQRQALESMSSEDEAVSGFHKGFPESLGRGRTPLNVSRISKIHVPLETHLKPKIPDLVKKARTGQDSPVKTRVPEGKNRERERKEGHEKDLARKKIVKKEKDTENEKGEDKRNREVVESSPSRNTRSKNVAMNGMSNEFKCPCVLFTGIKEHDDEDRELVESLGGTVTTDPRKATILVTDKVRRTVKFLCAVSRGIPIVSIVWLQVSVKSKKFLNYEKYILHDPEAEAKFKFNLGNSLARARESQLLQGKTIVLTSKLSGPSLPELKIIVQMAGGKPMVRAPSVWPDQSVIVTSPDDLSRVKKMIAKIQDIKVYVVHIEFLLSGILRQQLDYEEFALHV